MLHRCRHDLWESGHGRINNHRVTTAPATSGKRPAHQPPWHFAEPRTAEMMPLVVVCNPALPPRRTTESTIRPAQTCSCSVASA